MTIGIYKLVFSGTDKVYIGQSKNIEYRFTQHKYAIINGTASKKLLDAYKTYGPPAGFEVLCECNVDELDSLENEAIEIYSAYTKGLNTFRQEGGSERAAGGLDHWNSKYSKIKILRIFSRLYKDISITYAGIARLENVKPSLVHNIASGQHHLWLRAQYPDKFKQMLENGPRRNILNVKSVEKSTGVVPKIVSPKGDIFEVPNIRQFCINHPVFKDNVDNSRSAIGKLIKGRISAYKGWKLFT